jgi:hypothetical protein
LILLLTHSSRRLSGIWGFDDDHSSPVYHRAGADGPSGPAGGARPGARGWRVEAFAFHIRDRPACRHCAHASASWPAHASADRTKGSPQLRRWSGMEALALKKEARMLVRSETPSFPPLGYHLSQRCRKNARRAVRRRQGLAWPPPLPSSRSPPRAPGKLLDRVGPKPEAPGEGVDPAGSAHVTTRMLMARTAPRSGRSNAEHRNRNGDLATKMGHGGHFVSTLLN